MNFTRQFIAITLCAAVASALIPAFTRAQAPATQAASKKTRTVAAIEANLNAARAKLMEAVPYSKLYAEAKFRKENADKVIPLLKQMTDLLQEAATLPDLGQETVIRLTSDRIQALSLAVALGDKDAVKALTETSAKSDEEGLAAKSGLVLGNWVNASEDAAAQQKILDEYAITAKDAAKAFTDLSAEKDAANAAGKPADANAQKLAADRDTAIAKAGLRQDIIADTLFMMWDLGAANDAMSKKALGVIKTLNSEGAKQAAAAADAEQAKRSLVGRPLTIKGRTTAGANFTSSEWKGKVVLVDFWATWCGPCVESIPHIKKLYADYHGKGLEVVGVDGDTSDDRVTAFIKENAMPWPQLREQTQTEDDMQHPLAKKYGVDAIPTIFLIDKKGALRYIDGDEDTENKIKKLLEEPDAKPAPAPAAAPTPAPAPAK